MPPPFTEDEVDEVDEAALRALAKTDNATLIADLTRGPYLRRVAERYGVPTALFREVLASRRIAAFQEAPPLPDECEWIPEDEPSYHRRVEAGEYPELVATSIEKIVRRAVRMGTWHVNADGTLQRWDLEEPGRAA